MLLHVNPDFIHLAEQAAHQVSGHLSQLRKRLPGYGLFHGETLAALELKFAEVATPALIELALLATDFISPTPPPNSCRTSS